MALQMITIFIDTEKVTEYGTLILKVIAPRADLPHGTVLLHDPLSLPGFKMHVTDDAATIAVTSKVVDYPMPIIPKNEGKIVGNSVTPADEKVVKKPQMSLFRKDKKTD